MVCSEHSARLCERETELTRGCCLRSTGQCNSLEQPPAQGGICCSANPCAASEGLRFEDMDGVTLLPLKPQSLTWDDIKWRAGKGLREAVGEGVENASPGRGFTFPGRPAFQGHERTGSEVTVLLGTRSFIYSSYAKRRPDSTPWTWRRRKQLLSSRQDTHALRFAISARIKVYVKCLERRKKNLCSVAGSRSWSREASGLRVGWPRREGDGWDKLWRTVGFPRAQKERKGISG